MTLTVFDQYSFREVINRPDRGAGFKPFMVLEFTPNELLDLCEEDPKILPSFSRDGQLPSRDDANACTLLSLDQKEDGREETERIWIEKDLYAIFATVGYLITNYNLEGHVFITRQSPGNKRRTMDFPISREQFESVHDVRSEALGFYEATLMAVGIDAGATKEGNKKITVKIALMPSMRLH